MVGKRVSNLVVAAALAATMIFGILASQAQAALRHIDGTVVSKVAGDHTFRITTQGGGGVQIRVNGSTVFQRIAGFGALHKGMSIEVEARTTSGGLVAKHVEPRGGGGGNGAGGGHDGPSHT